MPGHIKKTSGPDPGNILVQLEIYEVTEEVNPEVNGANILKNYITNMITFWKYCHTLNEHTVIYMKKETM